MSQALVKSTPLVPQTLADLMGLAQFIVGSKLCPEAIDTPDKAAIVILAGHELGIGVMQSLRDIYPVHGQPGLSTKLMIALYREAGHTFTQDTRTPREAQVTLKLASGEKHTCNLTREQADAARWSMQYDKESKQWVEKPSWKTMPDLMLMNRCISRAIRAFAPEVLFRKQARQTTYTPDELHDPDIIDGQAKELPQAPIQEAPSPAATQDDNRNDPQPVTDEEYSNISFQRTFFAWLTKAAEHNGIHLTGKPLYEALKTTGKMKPHLRLYTKLEFAQADALQALADLKRQNTDTGK